MLLDGFPTTDTHIRLDAVFNAITESMYEIYVYMNRIIIHVAGHEFTLWNFVIGAMIIAFLTAASSGTVKSSPIEPPGVSGIHS